MSNIDLRIGDCLEVMKTLPSDYIDLTITSPPYDNLRTYNGYSFDFENVAKDEFYTFTTNKKMIGRREDTQQPIYENVFNFFQSSNNDESNELNKATFSTQFVNNIIERYVKKSDIVLDNFSGTGTTMIACEMNQIKSIGIELSEKQCKYSVNRIKKGIQLTIDSFI